MRLTTIRFEGIEEAAIVTETGLIRVADINHAAGAAWSTDVMGLLERGELAELAGWSQGEGRALLPRLHAISLHEAVIAPLYRHPRKIWGIGANYREKAEDMAITPPNQEPICFMKPDTSLIGPFDAIRLGADAGRVTAEAELGIIIGRTCKNISPEEAPNVVAGFTPTLDMTDQDIHARNPRFLGRSKVFDTFFSFGPELVTLDEVPDLNGLEVVTAINGRASYSAKVEQMIYSLWFIVSYFSKMMTLLPGDIIMTGTPGSVGIHDGDTVECRISGFAGLVNPVLLEK